MRDISPSEIAMQAVADAVTAAVRDDPSVSEHALEGLAAKVAKAVLAGIAVVTAVAAHPEQRN